MKKLAAILIISSLFTSACVKQTNQKSEFYSLVCHHKSLYEGNRVIYEKAESMYLKEINWHIEDNGNLHSYTPIQGEFCSKIEYTFQSK